MADVQFTETFLHQPARRQRYEQEASMVTEGDINPENTIWEQISPLLDGALSKLGETDRRAILLRFFEEKNLAEVGVYLGISEDAARMRVNRAVERLRRYFTKRGVTISAVMISGVLAANSVNAAPSLAANVVASVALTKGAATGSSMVLTQGALKLMAWAKAKAMALWVGCAVCAAGIPLLVISEWNSHENGIPRTWAVLDGVAEQWEWSGGVVTAKSVSYETILASTKRYRDFNLSATISTTNREASLAFRMRDADNGYLALFSPANTPYPWGNCFVSLVKKVDGVEYTLGTYSGKLIPSAGQPVRLSAVAKGPWLTAVLNGVTVLRIKDTTFGSGLVGLRIYGDGAYPCHASFSDIKLSGEML